MNTILIVDDDTAILTALKICLDGVFDRIITLSTPDNILTTLQQEQVDVVLLDMNFTLGVNSGQEGLMCGFVPLRNCILTCLWCS